MSRRSPKNKSARYKFHRVNVPRINRSRFRQPSKHQTAFDSGYLIPYYVKEILPGDTINLNTTAVIRLTTPLYPFMDNIYIDTHYFFVPNRLVWDNWERFQGAQDNPSDSTDFLVPQVTAPVGGFAHGSIFDYAGVPPGVDNISVNALVFRGINLIRNEWFRDQNLQDSFVVNTDDGPDLDTDYTLFRRGKRHDYFTSALPFLQKGDPVSIPIGSSAPVLGIGSIDGVFTTANASVYETNGTGTTTYAAAAQTNRDSNYLLVEEDPNNPGHPGIYADLSSATASTINDLRLAFQSQAYLELLGRAGSRHSEFLQAFWGVDPEDGRLQRPEYLGGGSQSIDTYQVPNTAHTTTAGADLGAYAQSITNHGFMKSFSDYGFVIGFASVRADMTYQQGIDRMWSRRDPFDYALPIFAKIGEQAILNKEIYAQGTADDDLPFGYTERFNEYRYETSRVSGAMRSSHPTPLDAWHLAYDFENLPVLSDAFIQETPPISRVVRVPSEPQFKADFYNECIATRVLPVSGVPGMLFRF